MPELTLPALGIYELYLLAAGAVTALFLTSPAGQKASQKTAEELAKQLEKIKQSTRRQQPQDDTRLGPDIIPPVEQECPKKKKCPVCGQLVVPGQMVSEAPPYVPPQTPPPGRVPLDKETILARPEFVRKKGARFQGAQIYEGPNNQLYYRDNLHVGNSAQIEVFDSRGNKHLGTVCPNCGQVNGKPDKSKKPIL
jgi:hypothetical protein